MVLINFPNFSLIFCTAIYKRSPIRCKSHKKITVHDKVKRSLFHPTDIGRKIGDNQDLSIFFFIHI